MIRRNAFVVTMKAAGTLTSPIRGKLSQVRSLAANECDLQHVDLGKSHRVALGHLAAFPSIVSAGAPMTNSGSTLRPLLQAPHLAIRWAWRRDRIVTDDTSEVSDSSRVATT